LYYNLQKLEGVGIGPTHSQGGARRLLMVSTTLRPLCPKKRSSTYRTVHRLGLGAVLNGHGKFRSNRLSNPGPSSPLWVAIPTVFSLSPIYAITCP